MPRYDGIAEWYDDYIAGEASTFTELAGNALVALAGSGSGKALDVGCGTGIYLPRIAGLGWKVTGLETSADQLVVARRRARISESIYTEAMPHISRLRTRALISYTRR